jgi:hypothetical protein
MSVKNSMRMKEKKLMIKNVGRSRSEAVERIE